MKPLTYKQRLIIAILEAENKATQREWNQSKPAVISWLKQA